jgi:hypothetical protein
MQTDAAYSRAHIARTSLCTNRRIKKQPRTAPRSRSDPDSCPSMRAGRLQSSSCPTGSTCMISRQGEPPGGNITKPIFLAARCTAVRNVQTCILSMCGMCRHGPAAKKVGSRHLWPEATTTQHTAPPETHAAGTMAKAYRASYKG